MRWFVDADECRCKAHCVGTINSDCSCFDSKNIHTDLICWSLLTSRLCIQKKSQFCVLVSQWRWFNSPFYMMLSRHLDPLSLKLDNCRWVASYLLTGICTVCHLIYLDRWIFVLDSVSVRRCSGNRKLWWCLICRQSCRYDFVCASLSQRRICCLYFVDVRHFHGKESCLGVTTSADVTGSGRGGNAYISYFGCIMRMHAT